MHAGVDFDPELFGDGVGACLQNGKLMVVMNDRYECVATQKRGVAGVEEPFQQENRLSDHRLTKRDRFLNRGYGKRVSLREYTPDPAEAVAITVGLDDRHDPRARRMPANKFEVVAQCLGV